MSQITKIEINVSTPDTEVYINETKYIYENTIQDERDLSDLYISRRERRLKQSDLAKILDIHPVTYGRKERGDLEFTLKEAFILSNYFNTPIEVLFKYLR